ncbi:MAG: gamma-glutamyl-gamma-aminobutyrate hydrolase family protein [Lachnospiraceae bacterium]|nr:gamma-glutamyl-gamma-aminobutyrate hydrolase family protein [Lachnospiraceae bacterium]
MPCPAPKNPVTIAILGRSHDTGNYENSLRRLKLSCFTTLDPEQADAASHLLLPGGGDITPAFFGQQNHGSRGIDTELDILQMQALDSFLRQGKPVLGICKGIQIINVALGGTLIQHIPTAVSHQWNGADQHHQVYHSSLSRTDFFYQLYGLSAPVNSAHHQALDQLGKDLLPVCRAGDNIIEGIQHAILPVIAVQWHPERLPDGSGDRLLQYFAEMAVRTVS